jgi:subtilase family serine protease
MAILSVSPRITRPLPSVALCTAFSFFFGFAGLTARGYASVPTPQITGPISTQQRVTLHGNVRPLPATARDLGAVAANLPSGRVQLLLKRPAAQQAELTQFLEDVQTPGSAVYHKWLTPAELGAQFGPAEADVQAVVSWLGSQGFAVNKVNQARTAIEFTGTAGQLQRTFGTQIHTFQVGGELHISNITNPQIPAALAPVVAGLSPLNDFRMKPMHTLAAAHIADAAPTSANPHAFAVRPDLTRPNSNGTPEFYVTPGDLATIYNVPNSALNQHYAASANLTGSGVQVGIAGVSNVDMVNVSNYRSLLGVSGGALPTVTVDGSDPGVQGDNAVEALLDLEQVSAVAPNAAVTLYIAQDTTFQQGLFLAIQRALDENKVGILNVSFGGCEAYQTQAGNQQVLNFWQQAAAQGMSVTVSTGDSDAAGCDSANALAANQGLQVNALASTPYNIAVGGTDFNQTPATAAQYWNATNSSIFESAIGPIPEIPWNNSTTTLGGFAQNVAAHDSNGSTRIDGAGGGVSGCLNGTVDNAGNVTACTGAYAEPSFQSGFGSGTVRQLPDVSMFAANGGHQASYLLCASGLGGDQPTDQDCVGANGTFGFQAVGGTSASSPVFAGVLALVSQSVGGARLGQADYTLYPLSRQHAAAFHDVAIGNISALCTGGTPNCGSNSFLTGYDAATGYDLATGLGSVDVTQLVQNWGSVTFRGTSTALQLNGSSAPVTITHGTPVQVAVSVSGSGGTPAGIVALVNNSSTPGTGVAAVQGSTASPSIFTLSNGSASGSYAFLPGGTYAVQANYAGDGVFAGSSSNPIPVTVRAEASTLDFGVLDFQAANNGSSTNANGGSFPYGTSPSLPSRSPVPRPAAQRRRLWPLASSPSPAPRRN